jgi:hypothetical protein
MGELCVIIPSKTAGNLNVCVRAILKHDPGVRIIIINDGLLSRELTEEVIGNCEIYPGEKPFVFARNCNKGIKLAGSADVVLLNDDAILKSQGGFSLLSREAATNRECGCVGAVTNVTGASAQKPQRQGLRHVHHIAFVCVLIPRRTIEMIKRLSKQNPDYFTADGLLDERYCLDYGVEDRDYCEMITRAGMKVGVHDGCYVDHGSLVSSFRGAPMAPGRSNKNRALFLEKFKLDNYFKWA